MTISGFSFVRNGVKLYYPVAEMVKSILPLVDEFVIAIGKGDKDDTTRDKIVEIGDPKIKIIDTEWEEQYFKKGIINAIGCFIFRLMRWCTKNICRSLKTAVASCSTIKTLKGYCSATNIFGAIMITTIFRTAGTRMKSALFETAPIFIPGKARSLFADLIFTTIPARRRAIIN